MLFRLWEPSCHSPCPAEPWLRIYPFQKPSLDPQDGLSLPALFYSDSLVFIANRHLRKAKNFITLYKESRS
jgi:hypothetical protein